MNWSEQPKIVFEMMTKCEICFHIQGSIAKDKKYGLYVWKYVPSEGGPTPIGTSLVLFPFCFWTTSLMLECDDVDDTSVGRYTSPQPLSVFLPPLKPMPTLCNR